MSKHILIADDDAAIVAALHLLLSEAGYQTLTARNVEEVQFIVKNKDVDLVLLDMNYHLDTTSGQEGLQLLDEIASLQPDLPVVAMTGWSSVELSVAAMQKGAGDFIEKPWDNERLLSVVRNQLLLSEGRLRQEKLGEENALLRQSLGEFQGDFLTSDPLSKQLMATARQVANSAISVLLLGENGTGKSKLAYQIHRMSDRRNAAFIAVNMGAIPENLFESEMFGHVKGAFTDARSDRTGRFELAHGGTLFLDEIANIPLSQQAKLLRVLESQEYERVGSSRTRVADVRIICATNAHLAKLTKTGAFRQDLLYRLAGLELTLPALRERPQDILPLAQHCLHSARAKYKKPALHLASAAQAALLAYDWPGNVRELQHCIERAAILCATEEIGARDLRLLRDPDGAAPGVSAGGLHSMTLDEIERQVIEQRLQQFDGQAMPAAESLGLSRSAFYRRLEKYRIETKA